MSCYALAERLHLSVKEVKGFSLAEFNGWCLYFEQREKQANPSMLDSPELMLKGFGL